MPTDPLYDELAEKALRVSLRFIYGQARRLLGPRRAPYLLQRLKSSFEGRVEILNIVAQEPEIKVLGPFEFPKNRTRLIAQKLQEIRAEKKANEPQAILVNQPDWSLDRITLEVKILDFARVRALRDAQKGDLKPQILSANAVIICNDTKEIVLQVRSSTVDTEMNKLHTLGGAFWPKSSQHLTDEFDHGRLSRSAAREIGEETEMQINLEKSPLLLLSKELSTGYIQMVLLGVNVSKSQLRKIKDNWEGRTRRVPFKDLPRLLIDTPDWALSGKAHVLAWLGCGAPGARRLTRFGKLTPHQLFNLIVGSE